jgi:hypothetical protein
VTDLGDYVLSDGSRSVGLSEWQRETLQIHLSGGARFTPDRPPPRVRVKVGDRWHGPYQVVSWDEAFQLDAAAVARRARLSRIRAAYRRKR